jgi:hypothetical protein
MKTGKGKILIKIINPLSTEGIFAFVDSDFPGSCKDTYSMTS